MNNRNRHIYYALAGRGHNVTVLSPDLDQEKTPNLHYIHLEGLYETFYNGTQVFDFVEMAQATKMKNIDEFWEFCRMGAEAAVKSKGFKTLLNYPDTFKVDLLMIDLTVGPYMIGFMEKFNYPPTVGVSAFSYPHYLSHSFGGHRQQSYVPHYESDFPNEMTLFQRVFNHVLTWYDDHLYFAHFLPEQDKLMRDAFGFKKDVPYVFDLTKKVGLMLTNTYFAVEKIEPLPPSVIPVGGLQIQEPKPLQKEVKAFIEAGKKGTVLFSLGTNLKSEMLNKKIVQMFLNVFKEMPDFNFLWKYESDLDLDIPKNVKLQGWVRQSDVLAHPNTKGFISHCGLLSTQEAMWHGVPVIGMPFFADQLRNIVAIIRAGMGVKIHYPTISHESFKAGLKEVLENPKYLQNAKQKSSLFQDQIDKPLDRAVFWLEWAIRHKDDMQALESPVKEMGIFKGGGYDICLMIFIPCVIIVHIIKFGVVALVKKILAGKKTKKD